MKVKIRRFDPFGGVSRPMIEAEAKYVDREMKDYLLFSLADLRDKLAQLGSKWHHADEALHATVMKLPERDRLAVQCLIVRDQLFLIELYLEHLRQHEPEESRPLTPPVEQPIMEPIKERTQAARTPFCEWLFGT